MNSSFANATLVPDTCLLEPMERRVLNAFHYFLMSCISFFGTPGNVAVVVVVTRHPALQTWENAFHFHLAVADLITCVVVLPCRMVVSWCSTNQCHELILRSACVLAVTSIVPHLMNCICMAAVGILRCYKLHRATTEVDKQIIKVASVLAWAWCLVVFMVGLLEGSGFSLGPTCSFSSYRRSYQLVCATPAYTFSLVGTIVSYSLIFRKVQQQRSKILPGESHLVVTSHKINEVGPVSQQQHPQQQPTGGNLAVPNEIFCVELSHRFEQLPAIHMKVSPSNVIPLRLYTMQYMKSVIVSSIMIVVVYYICSVPLMVLLFANIACGELRYFLSALHFINAFVNPYIYSFRNKTFREACYRVFRPCFPCAKKARRSRTAPYLRDTVQQFESTRL